MESVPNRSSALFAVVVGLLMIIMWGVLIGAGEVPELRSGEVEIYFHLAAEFLTAFALILGGAGVFLRRKNSRRLLGVGFGMLLYTLIASTGYYVDLGETAMVVMFALLFLLTLGFLRRLLTAK